MTRDPDSSPEGYGSARDLPSVAEMIRMLDGMGVLTRFVARRLRPEVRRLKQQIEEYVFDEPESSDSEPEDGWQH